MMMSVLFATSETCSVLGTWGFNLCMIKGFSFVVRFFLFFFFFSTKMSYSFGFCRLGFLGRGPGKDCVL